LTGRSERTRALSQQAGIADVPDMKDLIQQADLVMSITVSEVAPEVGREVAEAIRETKRNILFAECNAIAPSKAKEIEPIISDAGGRFVDVSIIGSPPRNGCSPRFYTSGERATEFEEMAGFGLDVRNIGPNIGQASGIKMCYAAMTKGTAALHTELLMAAELMGLFQPLREEFQSGQGAVYQRMERGIPGMPAKSRRWVSEMQEIEATFGQLGMTPHILEGVADMYRLVGDTELGEETPESKDRERSLEETIRILTEGLKQPRG
jgi:3-hydroxyisobutyrate dehydrogenase-like beta-hydroxyacid dehydrogenase